MSQRLLLEEGVRSDKRHHPSSTAAFYQRPQPANLKRGVGIDSMDLSWPDRKARAQRRCCLQSAATYLAMGLKGASTPSP